MQHPYKDNNEDHAKPRYGPADFGDLDDLVNGAVRSASRLGSSVLGSISDALREAAGAVRPRQETKWEAYRRHLTQKLDDSFGGWLAMAITGGIMAGGFGIAALVMWILFAQGVGFFTPDEHTVFSILAPVFSTLTVGFAAMAGIGGRWAGYFSRLRRYIRLARDWQVDVVELARGSVKQVGQVRQDLLKAVAAGHLPDACLDKEEKTLYLDAHLYRPQAAPAPQPAAQAAPEEKSDLDIFRENGIDFINYLGRCRGKLDPTADAELETMRKTCASIVGFIHNHPNQLPRVRRFAEYYMPTTRKLLDTALGLGDTDTEGAETIRRDITGILHTLNVAYGRLYDTLLQEVSLDVSAEIDTLEAMLSQDGLTHDFMNDFGSQQTASE